MEGILIVGILVIWGLLFNIGLIIISIRLYSISRELQVIREFLQKMEKDVEKNWHDQ